MLYHKFFQQRVKFLPSKVLHSWTSTYSNHCRNHSTSIDRVYLFKLLNLSSFSKNEIKESFSQLSDSNEKKESVNLKDAFKVILSKKGVAIQEVEAHTNRLCHLLDVNIDDKSGDKSSENVVFEEYHNKVIALAERLDSRIWPVAGSFLLSGMSIGIIIPCMPLLISLLEIPPQQFGMIVAAFGVSKLFGNIPSAYLVDKYGRKPALAGGLALIGVGIGGIGLAVLPGLGAPYLMCCRFLSGLGVSAFVGGAMMYVSDISTALNRTRSMAPVNSAFQAGLAFGPAVGGYMIDYVGIPGTYGAVGGICCCLTMMNHFLLSETKQVDEKEDSKKVTLASGIYHSFGTASTSWKDLIKSEGIKTVLGLNTAYWFVLSGTQLTLLPMYMVSGPVFHLSASEIGTSFALMSVAGVAIAQPAAYLADKYGKPQVVAVGSGLVGVSMLLLPEMSSYPELLGSLVLLALGSTAVSTVNQAHMADLTTTSNRAQALALLRTVGDVGLLVGALSAGMMADVTSIADTMHSNGVIMLAGMTWFGLRSSSLFTRRENVTK